jgi:NADH:ubiquinone oxidoreductase subunit 6 (subunit J)
VPCRDRSDALLRAAIGAAALALLVVGLLAAAPAGADAAPPATAPVPAAPGAGEAVGSAINNDFIPPDVDLSECISANPRPGCGSENRSGWRQYLILAALLVGVVVIAWRITLAVRARDRSLSDR